MPSTHGAPASSSDDPVIYFTLIDFLLQVIFCSLMLFVVFQHSAHARRPESRPGWVEDPVYLPLVRDMTPFITIKKDAELRELLRRLKDQGALERFLDYLRSNPLPVQLTQQCQISPAACQRFAAMTAAELEHLAATEPEAADAAPRHGGNGKPPCLSGDPALFTVDAYDDWLVVSGISAQGAQTLKQRRMSLRAAQIIPKKDVPATFSPLIRAECRYAIRYIQRGDSEEMRHLTEQAVHPAIVRGAVP
jgi:hypothetical protein